MPSPVATELTPFHSLDYSTALSVINAQGGEPENHIRSNTAVKKDTGDEENKLQSKHEKETRLLAAFINETKSKVCDKEPARNHPT